MLTQTVFLGKSFIKREQSPVAQSPAELGELEEGCVCVCVQVREGGSDHSQRDSAFFLLSCQLLQKRLPVFLTGDCGWNCACVFSLARLWERAGKSSFSSVAAGGGTFHPESSGLWGAARTHQHKGPPGPGGQTGRPMPGLASEQKPDQKLSPRIASWLLRAIS